MKTIPKQPILKLQPEKLIDHNIFNNLAYTQSFFLLQQKLNAKADPRNHVLTTTIASTYLRLISTRPQLELRRMQITVRARASCCWYALSRGNPTIMLATCSAIWWFNPRAMRCAAIEVVFTSVRMLFSVVFRGQTWGEKEEWKD